MKSVLITGASSGIGYEFSHIYASQGFHLIIVARSEGKLYKLKKELEEKYGIEVFVYVKDLSEENAAYEIFDYTLENNLEVEVLINNAGFGDYGPFIEYDPSNLHQLLNVNIGSLTELTRYFLPLMCERHKGFIINLSSVASFCAGPDMSLYYASKAFVRSFSEAISEEVKAYNVHVLALCPGPTSTHFEQSAHMNDSKMFTFFKPKTAKEVAQAGYKASIKGKTLKYYGLSVKLMNIGSRILPRALTRKFAYLING